MNGGSRQARGVLVAGGVALVAVVGLLIWSGGESPDLGEAAELEELPDVSMPDLGELPDVSMPDGIPMPTMPDMSTGDDAPAPEEDPASDGEAGDEAAGDGAPEGPSPADVDALVARLPDPPGLTPIGDVGAPGLPFWTLFDQPVAAARDAYAGALMSAGLSAAPGPPLPGEDPGMAVLVVTDPETTAQVLVTFEQIDTDVAVAVERMPDGYDPSAAPGTVAPPSPEVASLSLLAALPRPEGGIELGAGGERRTFQVSAVPYADVVTSYLQQVQNAGFSVQELDRGEGLLTVSVTSGDGGTVTVDLLDYGSYTEIFAFT